MKDGSGDLDFGSDDEEDHSDATDSQPTRETSDQEPTTHTVDDTTRDKAGGHEETARVGRTSSTPRKSSRQEEYPYFVRRNNVTDERSRRLECHVRPEVAQRESDFRSRVAAALGTDTVSKTDAREFALKFAFENPDEVAELMREEGFDVVR